MGQSTEELKQQIAETRGDLGTTVDAISDRVSPSRVVERRKQKLAERWTSARESVMGSATDVKSSVKAVGDAGHELPEVAAEKTQGSPMVAGAIAFSLGFLAAAIFSGTETEAQLAQRAQELAQPAVDELKLSGKDAMSNLKDPVVDSAQHLRDSAASSAEELRGATQDAVDQTKDAAIQASEEVSSRAKEAAKNVQDR